MCGLFISYELPAAFSNVFDMAPGHSELSASRLSKIEDEKDQSVHLVSEMKSEEVKFKAKVSSLEEEVKTYELTRSLLSSEAVGKGTHHEKWNNELTSQSTELERSRVNLVVKIGLVELLKGPDAEKVESFVQERKELAAKLVETKSLPDAAST